MDIDINDPDQIRELSRQFTFHPVHDDDLDPDCGHIRVLVDWLKGWADILENRASTEEL